MKKYLMTALIGLSATLTASAQVNLNKTLNQASQTVNTKGSSLTQQEIVNGLKEALTVGANNSASAASKVDGFNRNSKIRIPFPQEAQRMKTTLENAGMKKQVDRFVLTLNRAAEEASKEAAPVFINAIRSMTLTDGVNILKGADNAATTFLQNSSSAELKEKFKPIVQRAIQKAEVTRYWNPLAASYNKVPGVQRVNPDLEEYITLKTMEGLFKLIADEELKIRKDPAARGSDLLKKVFGN
jgi:hypothetical protein